MSDPHFESQNPSSGPTQVENDNVQPAKVYDVIAAKDGNNYITMGGLELAQNNMDGLRLGLLEPVTKQGKEKLKTAIDYYKLNYDPMKTPSRGLQRKYVPVTTLQVDSNPAAGGKRNKSKKPKRRNSRSKRRKTVSKRRR